MIDLNNYIQLALNKHFNSEVKVWRTQFLADGIVYKYKIKKGVLTWKLASYGLGLDKLGLE
jgi:hypothetical protein|tara:strand:+ start:18424 stop:18606 length:183 start_codon:yes stop_codon:yes gene_type:complete